MAGYRGLLAPWIGGASAPASIQAGYRGLLAPWTGGVARPASEQGGYGSLLAFWTGGAFSYGAEPPGPPVVVDHGGGGRRHRIAPRLIGRMRLGLIDQDDILLILAAQIAAGHIH